MEERNESWVGSGGEGSGETETPGEQRPSRHWGGRPGEMQMRQDREHSRVFMSSPSHTLSATSKEGSLLTFTYSVTAFLFAKNSTQNSLHSTFLTVFTL